MVVYYWDSNKKSAPLHFNGGGIVFYKGISVAIDKILHPTKKITKYLPK